MFTEGRVRRSIKTMVLGQSTSQSRQFNALQGTFNTLSNARGISGADNKTPYARFRVDFEKGHLPKDVVIYGEEGVKVAGSLKPGDELTVVSKTLENYGANQTRRPAEQAMELYKKTATGDVLIWCDPSHLDAIPDNLKAGYAPVATVAAAAAAEPITETPAEA